MNHLMILLPSLVGLMSTAVVFGTDVFFLTVGRPALRCAAGSSATEVMGFIHLYGDRRMPAWGILAILSNLLLLAFSRSGHRAFYGMSLAMLIIFVVIYDHLSKPINRLQTEAAKTGRTLDNGRMLQASWDRSLVLRVPPLAISMLVQLLALVTTSN
jgi:hypothetical protein